MLNVDQLEVAWRRGEMRACHELVATLSAEARALLAAGLLQECLVGIAAPHAVNDALDVAIHRDRWNEAHDAFTGVRRVTLERDRGSPRPTDPSYLLLFVAENAAKTVFNATYPKAPFDSDSPAWLLRSLADLVRCEASGDLGVRVWQRIRGALLDPGSGRPVR